MDLKGDIACLKSPFAAVSPALAILAIGDIVRHPATARVSITLNWACNPVPFGSIENADGEAEADISSGSAAFFVANSVTWQQRHLA